MSDCNTCRWYIYPMLTSGKITTAQIPCIVPEQRYCSREWCEYERKEKDNVDHCRQ
jgi:hypothetical protein